jgi:hypothetical protein
MNYILKLTSLVLMLLVWSIGFAQIETGTVGGTVTDSSGAVVSGATVTLRNFQTSSSRTVQTTGNGTYSASGLNAGTYEVTVNAPGFQPYTARVEVTVGGNATVDATLGVTAQNTVVEVLGEGGTQVNTQTQEISQIVNTTEMANLPSLTRNPYDFVQISGNISSGDRTSQGKNQNLSDRGVGFTMNGQRSSGTEILLDGVENSNLFDTSVGQQIPLDAVEEYRVLTNNFSPDYGRAAGGVVNVITKSGTNNFHGSAWEFNRLSAYTANTVDNAQNGAPKGSYTRNQFGYGIGGPVIKNKLFFFQSTEWIRVRSAAVQTALIPTSEFLAAAPANVQSYFSTYGTNAPSYSQVLTKADVVNSGVTPGPLFGALPDSTPVFGKVNFSTPSEAGGGLPQNTYDIVGRVDYNLTDKTQMYVRYGLYSEDDFTGSEFSTPYKQYNVGQKFYNNATLFSLTHVFSPSLLSNTKLSFNRVNVNQPFNTSLANTPTLFLFNNASIGGQGVQFPGFFDQITGAGGLPYGGPQNVSQINEDMVWTKGAHSLKFGTQLIYIQSNRAYGAYAQAIEQLGTSAKSGLEGFLNGTLVNFQAAVDPQGKLPCYNDPFNGIQPTPGCEITLPATSPNFARSDRFKDWAVYAMDSYKATPRLTLNYGLRYEYYGVQHNNHSELDSNFYYGSGSSLPEQIHNGQVFTVPNSPIHKLWNPQYGTVSPRVGFAYDVFGNGKTSVRGGWGISYERNFGNVTFNVIQNPPNYATLSIQPGGDVTNSNAGPLAGSGGSVPLPPTSLRNVDENIRTASTQFYSLALEHQVAQNTVISANYSAARGIHLYDIKGYNMRGAANFYLGEPLFDAAGTPHYSRLNNQYSGINNRGSSGDSYYNALNIGLQSTNFRQTGLSAVVNYTYAHAIDNLSSAFSESTSASNGVGNLGYLDPFNPGLDRGNSDFDIRHRIVVALIYQTPWFRNGAGWQRQALGGYTITPLFNARTGTPFMIADSSNSLNAGAGLGIPRYAPSTSLKSYSSGSSPTNQGGNSYISRMLPAAVSYSNPAMGGISDFGPYPASMTARNAFRGPGAYNLDLALSKSFALTERYRLEFRAEGFNILNHHNFYINGGTEDVANTGYDAEIPINMKKGGLGSANPNVGGPANDERRFGQFALKFIF